MVSGLPRTQPRTARRRRECAETCGTVHWTPTPPVSRQPRLSEGWALARKGWERRESPPGGFACPEAIPVFALHHEHYSSATDSSTESADGESADGESADGAVGPLAREQERHERREVGRLRRRDPVVEAGRVGEQLLLRPRAASCGRSAPRASGSSATLAASPACALGRSPSGSAGTERRDVERAVGRVDLAGRRQREHLARGERRDRPAARRRRRARAPARVDETSRTGWSAYVARKSSICAAGRRGRLEACLDVVALQPGAMIARASASVSLDATTRRAVLGEVAAEARRRRPRARPSSTSFGLTGCSAFSVACSSRTLVA